MLKLCYRISMPRGFTLVEILVAITIVSLVSVVAIPNLRNFNNDQELDNAISNLEDTIRRAQSSASSNIGCSNGNQSVGWVVSISNSNYSLITKCLGSANETLYTRSWPQKIKLMDNSCGSSYPGETTFKGNSADFSCGGNPLVAQNFAIKLQNSSNTKTKILNISSTGVINEI